jgi:hypothetical protein
VKTCNLGFKVWGKKIGFKLGFKYRIKVQGLKVWYQDFQIWNEGLRFKDLLLWF